jgi:hypothetical protein
MFFSAAFSRHGKEQSRFDWICVAGWRGGSPNELATTAQVFQQPASFVKPDLIPSVGIPYEDELA